MSMNKLIEHFSTCTCRGRLGKLFKTEKNYYFLDMGTGKVAVIDEYMHRILEVILLAEDLEAALEELSDDKKYDEAAEKVFEAIEKEHILSARELETLTGDAVMYLEQILKDSLQNITLEVTERCNLRCKYCIYNESHCEYRSFGKEDMTWDIAKAAIDYLKEHSKDTEKPYIGFYGGEPLLNYSLIEKSVEYANSLFNNTITFSLTTNATIITDEIADFLAENDFSPIISLDGPEILHDANRVFIDGKGSFKATMKGVDKLVKAYSKKGDTSKIGFNIVVSGPDFDKEYDMIQEFFESNERIPSNVWIMTSFVDKGPKDTEYILPHSPEDLAYMANAFEPNYDWERKKRQEKTNHKLFVDGTIDKGMLAIHKRLLLDEPCKDYGMNGCCVPGQRRIYVTVDGKCLLCEKVGNIPDIGNVNTGLDIDKIRKIYVEDFVNEAINYCKNCWAVNLCSLCYVNCYDENGTHFNYRHESCQAERKYIEENLIRYHTILEDDPESLMHYNEIEFE